MGGADPLDVGVATVVLAAPAALEAQLVEVVGEAVAAGRQRDRIALRERLRPLPKVADQVEIGDVEAADVLRDGPHALEVGGDAGVLRITGPGDGEAMQVIDVGVPEGLCGADAERGAPEGGVGVGAFLEVGEGLLVHAGALAVRMRDAHVPIDAEQAIDVRTYVEQARRDVDLDLQGPVGRVGAGLVHPQALTVEDVAEGSVAATAALDVVHGGEPKRSLTEGRLPLQALGLGTE